MSLIDRYPGKYRITHFAKCDTDQCGFSYIIQGPMGYESWGWVRGTDAKAARKQVNRICKRLNRPTRKERYLKSKGAGRYVCA